MLAPLILAGARLEELLNSCPADESALEKGVVLRRRLHGCSSQVYYLYIPRSAGESPPLMVSVHGVSRNARQHARLLSSMAERYGVVLLAPLFSKKQFPDYQRLGCLGHGPRSDLALDRIISEVSNLTGADTSRFYLFGYSGGGQFAHRYAMAHPERVAAVVIGGAGWYTTPQQDNSSAHGVGLCRDLPSLRFDTGKFLRIPMTVVIGDQDTDRNEELNKSTLIDRLQDRNRLERALTWVRTMNLVARSQGLPGHYRVEMISGVDHSFEHGVARGAMHQKIFAHLFDRQYFGAGKLLARA